MVRTVGRRSVLGIVAGAIAVVFGVGPTAGTQSGTETEVEVDARNLHAFWESQRAAEKGREF